ncbi:hypothetical protein PYCCODRAFT_1428509 [Trametes coccinea BRFM310]|uniref:Uncharacterized protein n=1 Tax=Trametes coccinea (strain BRFM310) TaxID=1353009 RepID=A0A1Y2I8D6_TRAC3|nr:hypothetical protein PYCCODRAFT_1428509 [Trametes coccinea BRFM310]
MYYNGPQRPVSAYWPPRASPPLSPMRYSPGSYSGSYYDYSPEMRMAPMYPQYAQPMAQPPMIYRNQPIYYHRLMRTGEPMWCCRDICCCETCCNECCGSAVVQEQALWPDVHYHVKHGHKVLVKHRFER